MMKLVKVKTVKGDTIYINPEYIVSVRSLARGYHVSLTDFGFDITNEEFDKLLELDSHTLI